MEDCAETQYRAQFGEDRILDRELRHGPQGYFVDVGSYDGESSSNTYFLEKSLGWKGILVEADPKLHEEGKSRRPHSVCVNLAAVGPGSPDTVSFEIVDGCRWISSLAVAKDMLKRIEDVPTKITRLTVPAQTLDGILEAAVVPPQIGLLSIDVEGHEFSVLDGLNTDRWSPQIIILERNNHFPDARIMKYMRRRGYGWRRTTGCNDWFYAEGVTAPFYSARLFFLFYLPKYCTFFQPLILVPAKRAIKRFLRQMGLLEAARTIFGKGPRKPVTEPAALAPVSVGEPQRPFMADEDDEPAHAF